MSDTSSRQQFSVATANPDGSETLTPMKTWLRQHPDSLLGADLESVNVSQKNSRYIFRRLLIHGWNSRETQEEIRLFPPGAPQPDIEDGDLVDDDDPAYGDFRMETELRDFLANNLNLVKINEVACAFTPIRTNATASNTRRQPARSISWPSTIVAPSMSSS